MVCVFSCYKLYDAILKRRFFWPILLKLCIWYRLVFFPWPPADGFSSCMTEDGIFMVIFFTGCSWEAVVTGNFPNDYSRCISFLFVRCFRPIHRAIGFRFYGIWSELSDSVIHFPKCTEYLDSFPVVLRKIRYKSDVRFFVMNVQIKKINNFIFRYKIFVLILFWKF